MIDEMAKLEWQMNVWYSTANTVNSSFAWREKPVMRDDGGGYDEYSCGVMMFSPEFRGRETRAVWKCHQAAIFSSSRIVKCGRVVWMKSVSFLKNPISRQTMKMEICATLKICLHD